jgi:RNA polymerase sigma-70 factor (ECF subfamily)
MANPSAGNQTGPDAAAATRPRGLYGTGHRDRTEETHSPKEATLANDMPSPTPRQLARFEQVILPHLDSAYNLARWLTGNNHDAEDVVQDAYLRALEFFAGFRGGDGRPWLLAIVRHVCYDRLQRKRSRAPLTVFDEELHSNPRDGPDPVQLVLRQEDRELLRQALAELPLEFREVLVLRGLEGLSYKAIAAITDLPPGTIMSRLARGRERLRQSLAGHLCEGP